MRMQWQRGMRGSHAIGYIEMKERLEFGNLEHIRKSRRCSECNGPMYMGWGNVMFCSCGKLEETCVCNSLEEQGDEYDW